MRVSSAIIGPNICSAGIEENDSCFAKIFNFHAFEGNCQILMLFCNKNGRFINKYWFGLSMPVVDELLIDEHTCAY